MAHPESIGRRRVGVLQTIVINIRGVIQAVVEDVIKENGGRVAVAMQKAVTRIEPRPLAEVLVDLEIKLHAVVARENYVAIIVCANARVARLVLLGIIVEEFLANWVNFSLWDLITGIGCTCASVLVRRKRIEYLVQHQVAVAVKSIGI